MATTLASRGTLNIRIGTDERNLIDRAAQALGKNRTDFILEAARRAAEDTLLDRTVTHVSPHAYAAFLKRLDAPANPNSRLVKSMTTKAPWDMR